MANARAPSRQLNSAATITVAPARSAQPRGLFYLAGTEFWDRVSFHGLQSLLTLFMVEYLLLPGHVERIAGFAAYRRAVEGVTGPLSVQALAAQTFGIYIGLVNLMPVFGGLLGDRVLGRRRSVALGALLMTCGHFAMAFDRSFLLALLLIILGAGCVRGNIASQLSSFYAADDRRRADGFQIYYTMINLGAFAAPLITGTLNQFFGWHFAFAFAGVGMLVGLAVYLSGQHHMPAEPPRRVLAARPPLSLAERRRVLVLAALVPIAMLFWIAQSQVWNVYNLWVRDHVDLAILGWTMPVVWLQSLDGIAPVLFVPVFLAVWRWQAAHGAEPDLFRKLAIGCLTFAAGVTWLAAAPLVAGANGKIPLLWAVGFHLISNIGWLYFTPLMLALFARSAPAAINGLMIGLYMVSISLGSIVSGRLGGLYEAWTPTDFWLLHAALVGTGGLIFLLFARPLRRALTPPDTQSRPA